MHELRVVIGGNCYCWVLRKLATLELAGLIDFRIMSRHDGGRLLLVIDTGEAG